jgi:hypothetical protein
MIRRTFAVSAVLAAGSVIAGGLFWLFLNTPESNVFMLLASLVLMVGLVTVVAVTVNAAVLRARGVSLRVALAGGARGTGWFVIAIAPLLLAWWAIGRGDDWIARHQGEINAWFIARFGWADITRLLQMEMWISRWLRWAVLPAVTASLLATLLTRERSRSDWVRRAWHWRTLLVATLVCFLLFALPWQLVSWRPQLPPTWIEPAAAGLRLGVVFLLGLIGAAVMIIASVGPASAGRSGQLDRLPHD